MPSNSSLATLDKQLAKANKELSLLDGRVERAHRTIATVAVLREELEDRVAYLTKIKARKYDTAPAAAADDATPVLNTELDEPELVEETVVLDGDPRLTSAV